MPVFINHAVAPLKTRSKCVEDEENTQKASEQGTSEFEQHDDPQESPDEYRSEVVKEQGITGFVMKVANRLRTVKPDTERARARHHFFDLVRELSANKAARTPYSQTAAYKIRELLEERGLGETLLLDFEMLLQHLEDQEQERTEKMERAAQECQEAQRRDQEWDVVKEADAHESWEMI